MQENNSFLKLEYLWLYLTWSTVKTVHWAKNENRDVDF